MSEVQTTYNSSSGELEVPQTRLVVVPKVKATSCCPIIGRVIVLAIVLFASSAISSTWYTHGITWAYDHTMHSVPILECPPVAESFKVIDASGALKGPTCLIEIAYNFESAERILNAGITVPFGTPPPDALERCILPHDPSGNIVCYSTQGCSQVCRTDDTNENCPDPGTIKKDETEMMQNQQCNIWLASGTYSERLDCYKVQLAGFCGRTYEVGPGVIASIRGLFTASAFIVVFWLIAECGLRGTERDLKQEQAEGKARMDVSLPEKRVYLRNQVLSRWADEAASNYQTSERSTNVYGMSAMGGSVSGMSAKSDGSTMNGNGTKSRIDSRDPKKRVESNTWRRRLHQYRTLGLKKKETFRTQERIRSFLLNIFFLALLIGSQWCILFFSPQQATTHVSYLEALLGVFRIWEASSFLDWMIFVDVLLDFALFMAAVVVVKWPKKPVFAGHMQKTLEEALEHPSTVADSQGSDDDDDIHSEDTVTVDFVLGQSMTRDVCLMIACHKSVMTEERYETFTATLRAALMVFPPSHIFVCDNGPTMDPFDETQWATQQVHPDINYLYVPEGNKTFAFYWCNKYWIPFLQRSGRVPEFKYAVITDDDVPLPADLHIPHQKLDDNPNIKAVHFPLTAATPSGESNMLVKCQDIEYKLAAVHKLFQSTLSSSMSCHGAVALWDRETLDEIFYEHDTVFNGEDLYMGLSLLRKRDDSKIISSAQAIVPTYAPDNWGMLFRQRVKSWDVTSHKKTFTYLYEIFTPAGLCHMSSWVLKPYFVQELLTILLDWLRIFLLFGLVIRDWVAMLFMFTIFTGLLYVMVLLFNFIVLRGRKDLRASFGTVVVFPWYRLSSLLFRLGALCQNLFVYSHVKGGIKIRIREDEIRDIPPCPPHADVDWFTVWTGEPQEDEE